MTKELSVRFGHLRALDGVDIAIPAGRTLGLVGESGSGKSTLGRALLQLVPVYRGQVLIDAKDVTKLRGVALRSFRRRVQMVFQDPAASLDPRMTVAQAIGQGLRLRGERDPAAVTRLLDTVGLSAKLSSRLPHELSGGQRQRIAIARALAVRPEIIVLDEVTSALDVSVQAMILNLLRDLQAEFRLSYLFISHNMAAVRAMSDEIAVMYLGRIVEQGAALSFFDQPRHPYSRALLDAVPRLHTRLDLEKAALVGEPPDPHAPPQGCRFHTRCPAGPMRRPEREICRTIDPQTLLGEPAGGVACHFASHRPNVER